MEAGRLALASRHPLASALARAAGARVPYPDVREHPGEGVSAVVKGRSLRLGSPRFCGAANEVVEGLRRRHPAASLIAFSNGAGRVEVYAMAQTLKADAARIVAGVRGRPATGSRSCPVIGRRLSPKRRPRSGSPIGMPASIRPGKIARLARSRSRRASRPHGRRRAQRRPVARCCPRLDVAGFGRRRSPRRRPTPSSLARGWRRSRPRWATPAPPAG